MPSELTLQPIFTIKNVLATEACFEHRPTMMSTAVLVVVPYDRGPGWRTKAKQDSEQRFEHIALGQGGGVDLDAATQVQCWVSYNIVSGATQWLVFLITIRKTGAVLFLYARILAKS